MHSKSTCRNILMIDIRGILSSRNYPHVTPLSEFSEMDEIITLLKNESLDG